MIPAHLNKFVVQQDYSQYTPIDHAAWRYILRQLRDFLSKNAHSSYLEGLEKTGISLDKIPSIAAISEKIEKFGWTAVPVSGFIPPAAFMEMQANSILPIAADMRSLEHLLYTPAPDIVHEAAGHAPILVHPEFAAYLKAYAQVAKNAIISSEDLQVYDAIRVLSDVKENPNSTTEQIKKAESHLQIVLSQVTYNSEAALLSRMNWWTAEYGLIGSLENPKIFGAGLLSSIGESRECLSDKVKKIPLSLDCINYSYDITEPQPQLFVARDFHHLKEVLEQLSETMAYRKGGLPGFESAMKAKTVNTSQLNSGLQISGLHSELLAQEGQPIYLKFTGPTQLAYQNKQIAGQGPEQHPQGFGTPIGRVKGLPKCLSLASMTELESLGMIPGKICSLDFESGVKVKGLFKLGLNKDGKWLIFTFDKATVTFQDQTLFQPDWGLFDMAVGEQIISVFGGAADRSKFGEAEDFQVRKVSPRQFTTEQLKLHGIYQRIQQLREQELSAKELIQNLSDLAEETKAFPKDWLTLVDLLELCEKYKLDANLKSQLTNRLQHIAKTFPEFKSSIQDGIRLSAAH